MLKMLIFVPLVLVYYTCSSFGPVNGEEISITSYEKSNQTALTQCDIQHPPLNGPLQFCSSTLQSNEIPNQSNITCEDLDQIAQLDLIDLLKTFPPLITFNVNGISERCQNGTRNFLKGVRDHELWALKILDATAKLPSGILSGNVDQFGDYDECLSVSQARYCLAEIDFEPVWKEPYLSFRSLVHSHFPFRGSFNDPRHRVPNFSIIRWGICVPSECGPEDLQNALEEKLGVQARVRPSMCKKSDRIPPPWAFGDYFARLFFAFLLLAVTISSLAVQSKAPFLTNNSERKWLKLLLAFSLQNNWKQLTSPLNADHAHKQQKDVNNNMQCTQEIRAVHGIRALSALGLLMCHKSIALMYNPYINRTRTMENFGQPWSVIARTAIVYTDSFMIISGLLNARSLLNDLEHYGTLKFKEKLITRIFRITPNIVALILFCTYILPNVNSGPLWPDVIEHHSELCKENMWKNIFYVHNFFGFENMCLTHTHQVGIDMQLFLITPIFIYLWRLNKSFGVIIAFTVTVLSTVLRYWITIQYNLSHMIYYGISIKQMFDTANLSYILPSHRATIYFTGVILAFILKNSSTYNLNKLQATLCWIVALTFGAISMLGPFHMARLGYIYSRVDSAIYGSLSAVWWGTCLAWVIFASNYGYAGWFGDFLSWRGFQSFNKITYAFYLVQFPVIFYNIGIQKTSDEFGPHAILHFSETTAIVLLSLILTLCVEMPFQKLRLIMFQKEFDKNFKQNGLKVE